jgi:hypothetical protein
VCPLFAACISGLPLRSESASSRSASHSASTRITSACPNCTHTRKRERDGCSGEEQQHAVQRTPSERRHVPGEQRHAATQRKQAIAQASFLQATVSLSCKQLCVFLASSSAAQSPSSHSISSIATPPFAPAHHNHPNCPFPTTTPPDDGPFFVPAALLCPCGPSLSLRLPPRQGACPSASHPRLPTCHPRREHSTLIPLCKG